MAETKVQAGISATTFFSVVVQVFVSMTLVLQASARPADDGFRIFVMVYLALMIVVYTVGLLVLMTQRAKARRAGDGASQS